MVTIRETVPADEDRILELWQQLHAHHHAVQPLQPSGWTDDTASTRARIREAWTEPDSRWIFVALVDGELQGFVKLAVRNEFYRHAEVSILAVDENHRGTGIGTQLTNFAIEWFTARGESEIALGVAAGNTRAMELYERLGFHAYSVLYLKKLADGDAGKIEVN
jgi:ribosomal protein S18 acetylase RimI-like enzyme